MKEHHRVLQSTNPSLNEVLKQKTQLEAQVKQLVQANNHTTWSASAAVGYIRVMVYPVLKAAKNVTNPSLYNFVFGLDALRGYFLARYCSVRQLWANAGAGDPRGVH